MSEISKTEGAWMRGAAVGQTELAAGALPTSPNDPPIVARMMIEIRSDGTTTIARGGMTDATTGRTTFIEARGSTPLALALGLTKTVFSLSGLAARTARATARALLPTPRPRNSESR